VNSISAVRTGSIATNAISVAERFEALADHYPDIIPRAYVAALHLLATWRNQFVYNDLMYFQKAIGKTSCLKEPRLQSVVEVFVAVLLIENRAAPSSTARITL